MRIFSLLFFLIFFQASHYHDRPLCDEKNYFDIPFLVGKYKSATDNDTIEFKKIGFSKYISIEKDYEDKIEFRTCRILDDLYMEANLSKNSYLISKIILNDQLLVLRPMGFNVLLLDKFNIPYTKDGEYSVVVHNERYEAFEILELMIEEEESKYTRM